MNNIELIKEDYQIGDSIRLSCSLGIKEGIIVAFYDDRIKIQPYDKAKKPFSVLSINIADWEEGNSEIEEACVEISSSKINTVQQEPENTTKGDENIENETHENKNDETYVDAISSKTTAKPKTEDSIVEGKNIETETQKEEGEETITADNLEQSQPVNTVHVYKAGDIVPPEILEQWQQEKKKDISKIVEKDKKKSSKSIKKFTSFAELASLDSVVEDRKNDALGVVREMGQISSYGSGEYGFINEFKTGDRLWFKATELIDFDKSELSSLLGQYVVFTRSQNYLGPTAISIHKPNSVENIVNLAKSKFDVGQKGTAYELINHVLSSYPDSFLANQTLQYFTTKQNAKKNIAVVYANNDNYDLYKEAKCYYDAKQYEKAIDAYKNAISKDSRRVSAIKDLGMLYISLANKCEDVQQKDIYIAEARSLMDEYGNLLQDLSYLENFYYAIRDFENFKIIVKKLLNTLNKRKDGPRYVFLLNKLAAVYIKEGDTQTARDLLNQALKIYPDSTGTSKLLDIIDEPGSQIEERIDEEIKFLDIEVFNRGLSPFIEETLNKYDKYDGVKEKDRGNFTQRTLADVRSRIATFNEKKFAGIPRERAKYLLTEGKLMQQLEPEKTFELRSTMARYCNDMAKIHISDNSSTDIIRFYYIEAFALGAEGDYSATVNQLSFYLLSIIFDAQKLSKEINNSISIDNALKMVFDGGFEQKKWEHILNALLNNKKIYSQIVSKLYDNSEYRKNSVDALKKFGIGPFEIKTKEDYRNAWNRAREKRNGDYGRITASMKSLADTSNIEELSIRLSENIKECQQEWMGNIDITRINHIITQIAPALDKFHKASGFRSKEINCHEVENLLKQMIEEIIEGPTKLSYEAILPLLEQVLKTVNEAFENILVASKPTPRISLLRTDTVVNQKQVPLQIEIFIDKDSSPIYNVSIEIINNDEVQSIKEDDSCLYPGLIEGGDAHIFEPIVKVSDYVLENKAVAFEVKCKYINNGIEDITIANLSLHLYSPEDFTHIDNPYAAVAESGPLSADSKMFYGQKDYIKQVVDTIIESPSKQVIIYGQKRSGKSSVLNKVQQELSSAGAFCVQFSMGKIVRNISEFAFYYKILSEINFSLESQKEVGVIVPDFKIPSRKDFQEEDPENPVETFTRYMRIFKKACKNTPGWENRRLVVLIDEFTYMYGAIKMHKISPTIMMQWKAITQDEYAQFSVVLVGQDVIPAFKNEPYARNAFGVIKDLRLSYLKEEDARDLIINPICNNGNSRYNEKAVNLIMDYTACNPYYLQIFCSYLVDFMNKKHYNNVTEADIQDVVEELTTGVNALDSAKFENLLSSGETDNDEDQSGAEVDDAIKIYTDSDVEMVLKAVAKASSNKIWASRSDISTYLPKDEVTGILKQLKDRDVLDDKDDQSYYKIKVRLYKEWLLKH